MCAYTVMCICACVSADSGAGLPYSGCVLHGSHVQCRCVGMRLDVKRGLENVHLHSTNNGVM